MPFFRRTFLLILLSLPLGWIALPLGTSHLSQLLAATPQTTPFLVVLDPGHGGTDLGTVYSNGKIRVEEKTITLKLALETAKELKKRGIKVLLTRQKDKEVPLGDRTALANEVKADAFVSIHLNSPPADAPAHLAQAEGVETYILNNTSEESSRRLARLENSVLGNSEAKAANAPTEVALILKDLRLDSNLPESKELACLLQSHLSHDRGPGGDRGVKQALFHVLLGADMPSALVEVGFLSSPKDRARVLFPKRRSQIAHALADAISDFRAPLSQRRRTLVSCQVR